VKLHVIKVFGDLVILCRVVRSKCNSMSRNDYAYNIAGFQYSSTFLCVCVCVYGGIVDSFIQRDNDHMYLTTHNASCNDRSISSVTLIFSFLIVIKQTKTKQKQTNQQRRIDVVPSAKEFGPRKMIDADVALAAPAPRAIRTPTDRPTDIVRARDVLLCCVFVRV
jgi:hypothetical protein